MQKRVTWPRQDVEGREREFRSVQKASLLGLKLGKELGQPRARVGVRDRVCFSVIYDNLLFDFRNDYDLSKQKSAQYTDICIFKLNISYFTKSFFSRSEFSIISNVTMLLETLIKNKLYQCKRCIFQIYFHLLHFRNNPQIFIFDQIWRYLIKHMRKKIILWLFSKMSTSHPLPRNLIQKLNVLETNVISYYWDSAKLTSDIERKRNFFFYCLEIEF